MSESPDVELLHQVWDAMAQGDLTVLEDTLAPDAQWHGVEDGQLCVNRNAILDVMSRNLPGRVRGSIEETIQAGPRIVVAFRPDQPEKVDRPLDAGVAYMVVTIRDARIVELKGCVDRTAAIAYSQSDERPRAQ